MSCWCWFFLRACRLRKRYAQTSRRHNMITSKGTISCKPPQRGCTDISSRHLQGGRMQSINRSARQKRTIDLPGGPIKSQLLRESLTFLPATSLSLSQTLEEFFELIWCPSRVLNSPRALLPELQRYKDTVRCAELGTEVPGHRQQQLTQTLIVRLLKTHFLHRSLIVKSQQNRIKLVSSRPGRGNSKV